SYRKLNLVCEDGLLTQADLTERVMAETGTDGNDSLNGWEYADHQTGGAGNDTLNSGTGDDVLEGGTGNDRLYGGSGADRYLFSKGHGQDTVSDYSNDGSTADTLVFSGAHSADLQLEKNGNDLVIRAYGDGDSVKVSNYFASSYYRQITLQFDDLLMTAEMLAGQEFVSVGTEKDNSLSGWSGIDRLEGGAGNDRLSGAGGSDTLTGGTGNDYLEGGSNGTDRYQFSKGHGQDTVSDYSSDGSTTDTLVFKGADANDIRTKRDNNDLLIYAYGNEDSVRVSNYYIQQSHRFIELEFDDRTLTSDDLATVTWHFDVNPALRSGALLQSANDEGASVASNIQATNDANDLWFKRDDLLSAASGDSGVLEGAGSERQQMQLMVSAMAGFASSADDTQSLPEQMQQYMHQMAASVL
ncbi:MAG: hypothetical protein ACRCYL_03950, partial [Kluyvera sp.]